MMRLPILDRYVLRQFVPWTLIVLVGLTGLFTISSLFEHIDRFLDGGAGVTEMATYALLDSAGTAVFVMPMTLLVAALLVMGLVERTNEMTAMNVAGRSYLRVSVPMLCVATLASAASFLMQEYVIPGANQAKQEFMERKVQHINLGVPTQRDNVFLIGGRGRVYVVKSYMVAEKRMVDPVIQVFAGGRMLERTDAREASWTGSRWVLKDGVQRRFRAGEERAVRFRTLTLAPGAERPEDFAAGIEDPAQMPLSRLGLYIRRLRESGRPADRFAVDYHIKLSYPLINFIALLLAVGVTGQLRRSNVAMGFLVSVVASFLFYGVVATTKSLGQNGAIPPWVAGWAGHILFGTVAGWMLWKSPR